MASAADGPALPPASSPGDAAAGSGPPAQLQIVAMPGATPDALPSLFYADPASGELLPLPEHLVLEALHQLQAAGQQAAALQQQQGP
jgi:hypothetical protein